MGRIWICNFFWLLLGIHWWCCLTTHIIYFWHPGRCFPEAGSVFLGKCFSAEISAMGIYHYLATQHLVEFLFFKKNDFIGTSLEVLWLSLCASTAGATGSIPGWETDPNTWHAAKKKKNSWTEYKWKHNISTFKNYMGKVTKLKKKKTV